MKLTVVVWEQKRLECEVEGEDHEDCIRQIKELTNDDFSEDSPSISTEVYELENGEMIDISHIIQPHMPNYVVA